MQAERINKVEDSLINVATYATKIAYLNDKRFESISKTQKMLINQQVSNDNITEFQDRKSLADHADYNTIIAHQTDSSFSKISNFKIPNFKNDEKMDVASASFVDEDSVLSEAMRNDTQSGFNNVSDLDSS